MGKRLEDWMGPRNVDAKYDTSENFNIQPGWFQRYIVVQKKTESFIFCRSGPEIYHVSYVKWCVRRRSAVAEICFCVEVMEEILLLYMLRKYSFEIKRELILWRLNLWNCRYINIHLLLHRKHHSSFLRRPVS